jgi:hypothetical protein
MTVTGGSWELDGWGKPSSSCQAPWRFEFESLFGSDQILLRRLADADADIAFIRLVTKHVIYIKLVYSTL